MSSYVNFTAFSIKIIFRSLTLFVLQILAVYWDLQYSKTSLSRQKPQYPGTMPSYASRLLTQVTDRCKHLYSTYIYQIRLYVHTYLAMKKGTFSFNQCTYICTCMQYSKTSLSMSAKTSVPRHYAELRK